MLPHLQHLIPHKLVLDFLLFYPDGHELIDEIDMFGIPAKTC